MHDERSQKKFQSAFVGLPYLFIIIEVFLFIFFDHPLLQRVEQFIESFKRIKLFQEGNIIYCHLFVLLLIIMSSIGTKPKKNLEIKTLNNIILPIVLGLIFFFGALFFYYYDTNLRPNEISSFETIFIVFTFLGAIILNLGMDNISKLIRTGFMKDPFNHENESFQQPKLPVHNTFSLNLPMTYYHAGKIKKGWFNLTNPFRGTLVMGIPESGKSYSIIIPFIKRFIQLGHTAIIYDYKYPDIGEIAYYHYLLKVKDKKYKHKFHVINLNELEKSRRVNPLAPQYLEKMADCIETAEAIIESLQKNVSSGSSDQFFRQSAINYLSAVLFFLSRYKNGKFSSLPHALSFINLPYEDSFNVLYRMPELHSLLAPFMSAHEKKAYEQLEAQFGTLRINLARLATPETYWVFSQEDFDLRISNKENPAILIIANNPETQNINSATNAVLLNRLTKLVNSRDNHPCAVVVDEAPTIYFHKIQNLISTARSNKVAVVLGVQELPQLVEGYGKNVADTITSVIGNVISGAVRKKETLDWLQQLFGRVKQLSKSVSITKTQTTASMREHMDFLIPASKIADQNTGEIVAKLAFGTNDKKGKLVNQNTYNCKIVIDNKQLEEEQKLYRGVPQYYNLGGPEKKSKLLMQNMENINHEILHIVQDK